MEETMIRKLREERGLMQKDVAERLNTAHCNLSLYETGKRKLPIHIAKELGKIYGVEWSTLYEDDKGN